MPMTFRLRGLNHWSALLEARSIWLLALHNNTPITGHWQCHWQCHKNESKIATQSHQTPGRKFSESDIMFLMENTEPPHCQCWQFLKIGNLMLCCNGSCPEMLNRIADWCANVMCQPWPSEATQLQLMLRRSFLPQLSHRRFTISAKSSIAFAAHLKPLCPHSVLTLAALFAFCMTDNGSVGFVMMSKTESAWSSLYKWPTWHCVDSYLLVEGHWQQDPAMGAQQRHMHTYIRCIQCHRH